MAGEGAILVGDLCNHFNLHTSAHRDLRHPKRAAGMGSAFPKDLADERAGPVGDDVLLGEVGGGVHQRHQFDDAGDAVQIAHSRVQGAHQVNGDRPRGGRALFGLHVFPELPDPGLAVFLGDMAADENQFSGLYKRHISRRRGGDRGQGDVQAGEGVIDIHGLNAVGW